MREKLTKDEVVKALGLSLRSGGMTFQVVLSQSRGAWEPGSYGPSQTITY